MGITQNFECLLLTTSEMTYQYSSLIGLFLKELLPYFIKKNWEGGEGVNIGFCLKITFYWKKEGQKTQWPKEKVQATIYKTFSEN